MSAGQQKLMQYLPVFFAIFQIFFLSALVVYYIFQTLLRILQQDYITRSSTVTTSRSVGRRSEPAKRPARKRRKAATAVAGSSPRPSAIWPRAKGRRPSGPEKPSGKSGQVGQVGHGVCRAEATAPSKRVTPPKNRPTPSSGSKGRPTPSRKEAQAARSGRDRSRRGRNGADRAHLENTS